MSLRFLFFTFLFSSALRLAAKDVFVHPGVPFTAEDLAQIKDNAQKSPWKTGYAELVADPHSSLDYQMKGPFAAVSRVPHLNRQPWIDDMKAIHHLTFRWIFSGDETYARKATDMLNAWAVTNVSWGGDEAILDLGDWVQYYATAADILKSTYPGWTAENTKNVRHYFAEVLWPQLDVPNPVRGANQGADAIKAAVGIAAFLDDLTKWHQAIAALRNDPAAGLANTLPNGEVGDSGRDEGHTAGQIWNLAWASEVAWKQHVDVFADQKNRLLTVEELYSRYNLDPTAAPPFIPFGNPYELYTKGWGWTKPARRATPAYNIIEAAYTIRKHLPAPFTTRLRDEIPENQDTFLFRKTSDHSSANPLPALVHPARKPVTELHSSDIGHPEIAGSATFHQGTWTISGSGSIPVPAEPVPIGSAPPSVDACQFAWLPISGDAVAIVQILSVENTDSQARAGLMLRESLAPDARSVGIFLSPASGARTTWRGATAWTKTDTSWLLRRPGGYEEHTAAVPPYWLKLERIGTRIAVYNSFDGISWCCLENVETPIAAHAFLGLCVSSQVSAQLNTSVFSHVVITQKK